MLQPILAFLFQKNVTKLACLRILKVTCTCAWKNNYWRADCFYLSITCCTGQIAQVVRRSLLVREVWGSNFEQI